MASQIALERQDDSMTGALIACSQVSLQASYSPGRSPTVVFIHGGLGNRFNWRSQWEFLRDRRQQILAYDLAGHGQSGNYQGYSIKQHLHDLDDLLSYFKVKDSIFCCHSYGVTIGWEIAKRSKTLGLVAIAGGIYNLTPWWEVLLVNLLAWGGDRLFHSLAMQRWFNTLTTQHDSKVIQRFFEESPFPTSSHSYKSTKGFWGYDGRFKSRKDRFSLPIALITGQTDRIFTPSMAEKLVRYCLDHKLNISHSNLSNAGHLVMAEASDLVNKTIWQMIEALD